MLQVVKNPKSDLFNFGTELGQGPNITEMDFSLLKMIEEEENTSDLNCLLAFINRNSEYIAVRPVHCNSNVANSYFCITDFLECKKDKYGLVEQLDLIFDPVFSEDQNYHITQQTNKVHDASRNFNLSPSFENLFSALWYSSMPCYDLKGLTAHFDKDSSFLKYCEWKGIAMNCSNIFTTFPTDIGMC